MGIDVHTFNFLRLQAQAAPLGDVLTIGRQSVSLPPGFMEQHLGRGLDAGDGYCEPLLRALNATSVASLDFSDYEKATYVADLNQPTRLERQFDTVVDAGSLEHIFDVAMAFRNVAGLCKVGGRVVHVLPVNNLNGHGFWQFSSDLLYSVYSRHNGFEDTQVFYASSLDFSTWYRAPAALPGRRVEVVSVEPVILLSVTRKVADNAFTSAVQPFYLEAWDAHDPASLRQPKAGNGLRTTVKRLLKDRPTAAGLVRNALLIAGLATGRSRFSMRNPQFKRVVVKEALRGPA
jgi:SAM-dependent methyltransferase